MMKAAATIQRNAFEWRILLGPPDNWPVPSTEFSATQQSSIERCELCGEPITPRTPIARRNNGAIFRLTRAAPESTIPAFLFLTALSIA